VDRQAAHCAQTMIRLTRVLALVSLLCCTVFSESVAARDSHASLRSLGSKRRLEAVKRWDPSPRRRSGASDTRARDTSASPGVKNITFTNPKASGAYGWVHALCIRLIGSSHTLSEFYVDGKKIPLVDFDVGPSWSGLIPISGAANETGKVRLLGNCNFGSVLVLP
jgi:carboxypeptidase D